MAALVVANELVVSVELTVRLLVISLRVTSELVVSVDATDNVLVLSVVALNAVALNAVALNELTVSVEPFAAENVRNPLEIDDVTKELPAAVENNNALAATV